MNTTVYLLVAEMVEGFCSQLTDCQLPKRSIFFNEDPKIIFLSQMFSDQETKRQLVVHGDDSSIAKCRTKLSQYFQGCMEFFAVFKLCYIFIPGFLTRTLKMFYPGCELLCYCLMVTDYLMSVCAEVCRTVHSYYVIINLSFS